MDLVNFLIDLVLASLFLSFSILSSSSIITDNFRAPFFPPPQNFPLCDPFISILLSLLSPSSFHPFLSLLRSSSSHFIFTPLELFPTFILLFIQTFYHCLPRAFPSLSLSLSLSRDFSTKERGDQA